MTESSNVQGTARGVRVIDNFLSYCPSTTLLVSPGTKGFDLLGVEQPENEILEQPEQDLPMDGRQRASCHRGGGKASPAGRGSVKRYSMRKL
jgi:hypothetical protein